jgi:hypothetical protein
MQSKWNRLIDRVDSLLQSTIPPDHFSSMLRSKWNFEGSDLLPQDSVVVWVLYCCVSLAIRILSDADAELNRHSYVKSFITKDNVKESKAYLKNLIDSTLDFIFVQIGNIQLEGLNIDNIKKFFSDEIEKVKDIPSIPLFIQHLTDLKSKLSDIFFQTENSRIENDAALKIVYERARKYFPASVTTPDARAPSVQNNTSNYAQQTTVIYSPPTYMPPRPIYQPPSASYSPPPPVTYSTPSSWKPPPPPMQPTPPQYNWQQETTSPDFQAPPPGQNQAPPYDSSARYPNDYNSQQQQDTRQSTNGYSNDYNSRQQQDTRQSTNGYSNDYNSRQQQSTRESSNGRSNTGPASNGWKSSADPPANKKQNSQQRGSSSEQQNTIQDAGKNKQGSQSQQGAKTKPKITPEEYREAARMGREKAEKERLLEEVAQKAADRQRKAKNDTGNATDKSRKAAPAQSKQPTNNASNSKQPTDNATNTAFNKAVDAFTQAKKQNNAPPAAAKPLPSENTNSKPPPSSSSTNAKPPPPKPAAQQPHPPPTPKPPPAPHPQPTLRSPPPPAQQPHPPPTPKPQPPKPATPPQPARPASPQHSNLQHPPTQAVANAANKFRNGIKTR